mgnify:CR=1 FL=1
MIGITFFWLYGVGYYDRELPVIVVLGLGGAALAWGGQRVFQASKRKRVEQQITERDHQRGL